MQKHLDIHITIIFAAVLTTVMLWPLTAAPTVPEGSDKLVHLLAFASLAFPLARTGRIGLFPLFLSTSAFGGFIEVIQPSFNRSADVNDWISDSMGALLGIVCGLALRRLQKK